MTALKPIESLRVAGQSTDRYEANRTCAHPECAEPVPDRGHHIFPRSQIGNGAYFVQAWDEDGKEMFPFPIPHVTGLCRQHHDAVEKHDAWIKYENGEFVWYDRVETSGARWEWERIGSLDPQPGGKAKVHRPKRKRLQGDERRKRRKISVHVPDDTENGGEIWDDTVERVKERLVRMGLYSEGDAIPIYEAVIAGLTDWLNSEVSEPDERVEGMS